MYNFLKLRGLTPYTDALFNAHHDEIVKIYIFSKENLWLPPAFLVKKTAWEAKKSKCKKAANGVLKDAREDSESGIKT